MYNIITFKNKEQFNTIIKNLKWLGYKWVGDNPKQKSVSFEEIKNRLPKQTRTFAINYFYNEITKRKEMQYQTFNFYKKENKKQNYI